MSGGPHDGEEGNGDLSVLGTSHQGGKAPFPNEGGKRRQSMETERLPVDGGRSLPKHPIGGEPNAITALRAGPLRVRIPNRI